MKHAFYSMFFLFCLIFASQAFALPNCSMLELELNDVELLEGSTKTVTFALNNYAPERFYIDKVNAFDFEEGIATEELSWQGVALSQGQAIIRVLVRAESNPEERERKAKIELRGHFLNGKECKYSDVHGEFSVSVLKKPIQRIEPRCEGFSLYTLSEKFIKGFGEIEFIAVNKTNYPAIIKLESNNLGISDTVFYVPAGEEKLFKTEIQSAVEKTELVYKIELSDCGIPSEKTTVYSSVYEKPTPEELKNVELNASIARDGNGFIATVSIYNPNNVEINGVLEALVPENWQVIGEGSVNIEAFTEIIATLRIMPPEGFTGKSSGEIVFSYNGLEERQPIELEVEQREQRFDVIASALAVLSSSAITIGLILVIVILVLVLIKKPSRQEFQPWVEGK